jgi:predicted ribonuclease YlaK
MGIKIDAEKDGEKKRSDIIDEQIDTISRSLLGVTVACARCHNHKFDPIPTTDYYAMAGVLRSTDLANRKLDSGERRTLQKKIDRFKKELTETGRNARQFSRYLDTLRSDSPANGLAEGVALPDAGSLRIDLCDSSQVDWAWADKRHHADNLILAVARELKKKTNGSGLVVLVSKDTNMRIKADALGIRSEDYAHGKVLVEAGFDPAEVLAKASDPAVKEQLKHATEEAIGRRVFGAPTCFVNGEMFFGQDRLDWVEAAARS